MQLSENSVSISGWLQEYDHTSTVQQNPKPVNLIHRQKFSKRSVSLCQHRQEQEHYKSIRNSSQMPKPNQIINNKKKIQELKRIMEFLQVNEDSKYDAYHQYKQQSELKEENLESSDQQKSQIKIKLNCSNKQYKLQPLQEINHMNASTDRQQNCQTNTVKQRRTHLKTDHHQEILKSSSIHRILSIKEVKPRMVKQLNEAQNKQKELDLLQLMIERHKENVQQYLPKKNKYLR